MADPADAPPTPGAFLAASPATPTRMTMTQHTDESWSDFHNVEGEEDSPLDRDLTAIVTAVTAAVAAASAATPAVTRTAAPVTAANAPASASRVETIALRLSASGSVVLLAVGQGMQREELQEAIVFAFARQHAIRFVRGVYVQQSNDNGAPLLVPLGVLASSPSLYAAGGPLTLAVEPPLSRPVSRFVRFLRYIRDLGHSFGQAARLLCAPVALGALILLPWLAPHILEAPFRHLYRHGPAASGGGVALGFWEGAEMADICARMTSTEAHFWRAKPDECAAMYGRKEAAFTTLVRYGFCGLATWKAFGLVIGLLLAAIRSDFSRGVVVTQRRTEQAPAGSSGGGAAACRGKVARS